MSAGVDAASQAEPPPPELLVDQLYRNTALPDPAIARRILSESNALALRDSSRARQNNTAFSFAKDLLRDLFYERLWNISPFYPRNLDGTGPFYLSLAHGKHTNVYLNIGVRSSRQKGGLYPWFVVQYVHWREVKPQAVFLELDFKLDVPQDYDWISLGAESSLHYPEVEHRREPIPEQKFRWTSRVDVSKCVRFSGDRLYFDDIETVLQCLNQLLDEFKIWLDDRGFFGGFTSVGKGFY